MKIPFKGAVKTLIRATSKNSPTILAGMAIVGVCGTAFGVYKATLKAVDVIDNKNESLDDLEDDRDEMSEEDFKAERKRIYISFTKDMIRLYWPSALCGIVTIISIIGSRKIDARRQAALTAALTMTENRLKEYQDKVVETVGERKEQKIRDSINADKVYQNSPVEESIISTGKGDVLCLDAVSGRYFRCNADFIRNRINVLNERLLSEMYIPLNDLYYELNLPTIKLGDDIGWNVSNDGLIRVDFTSTLTDDDKPVLVLDYAVEPRFDYRTLR